MFLCNVIVDVDRCDFVKYSNYSIVISPWLELHINFYLNNPTYFPNLLTSMYLT